MLMIAVHCAWHDCVSAYDRESYTVELAVCVELEQWSKAKTLSLYGARLTVIRRRIVYKLSISELGKGNKNQRDIGKNIRI
jgi:hypothetical protein